MTDRTEYVDPIPSAIYGKGPFWVWDKTARGRPKTKRKMKFVSNMGASPSETAQRLHDYGHLFVEKNGLMPRIEEKDVIAQWWKESIADIYTNSVLRDADIDLDGL